MNDENNIIISLLGFTSEQVESLQRIQERHSRYKEALEAIKLSYIVHYCKKHGIKEVTAHAIASHALSSEN